MPVRVLAIDPGTVRLGLALSDPTGVIASPLRVLRRVSPDRDLAAIAALVREHAVEEVVVGLPRRLDGTLDAAAQEARDFAQAVRAAAAVPVRLWDERLTTVAAERHLVAAGLRRQQRRATVDAVAAALLLQSYLDARGKNLVDGTSHV